jgi:hypothetical protein
MFQVHVGYALVSHVFKLNADTGAVVQSNLSSHTVSHT